MNHRILPRNISHHYLSLCRLRRGVLFSVRSTNSLVDTTSKPPAVTSVRNPWVEQKDPKGSQLTYYWNTETNETTHLGSPKPRNWIEVKDPAGSALTYWWDPDAQETTALGAPKPSHLPAAHHHTPFLDPGPPMTLGQSMKQMFWWGAGISLAFATTRDRDLEDVFSKFGRVKEVHVAEDKNSGRSKGFAFVTMADSQGANDAIAGANGIEIDGRPIKVELSTGPPARNPDAARRGPREGGRGGGGRSDVCYDWQSGRCSRGTSCRFSHDDGSSRGRDRSRDRDGYRGRSRDRDSRRDDYRRDDRGGDRRDDRGGDRRDDRDRDYRGGRSDPYERRDGGRDRERSRDRY